MKSLHPLPGALAARITPGAVARSLALCLALSALVLGCSTSGEGEDGGDDTAGCRGADGDVSGPNLASPPVGTIPARLDQWNLFANECTQAPKDDVVPYEVTSPLFTDFAAKHRFIYVPPGEQIAYAATAKWGFPEGTVLIKTFAYPVDERDPSLGEQLIETRLLVHEGANGWRPIVYRWNQEQTEATRIVGGATVSVSYVQSDGSTKDVPSYAIPSNGVCRDCHGAAPDTLPIGPSTPMLNRDFDYGSGDENQVDHLHALGLFDMAPEAIGARLTYPDPESTDPLDTPTLRGRSYVQSNCAHCHSPTGPVADKLLFLDWESTDPATGDPLNWGVCKDATSAANAVDCQVGISYDVEPGVPEESLLACRVETTNTGLMPPVGRTLQHEAGLAAVEGWISDMNLPACAD